MDLTSRILPRFYNARRQDYSHRVPPILALALSDNREALVRQRPGLAIPRFLHRTHVYSVHAHPVDNQIQLLVLLSAVPPSRVERHHRYRL